MDQATQLDASLELLGCLGIQLRRERLGGGGGGLCTVAGDRVVFIDLDADLATRLDRCVSVLANLPELEGVFVPPVLRERIERARDVTEPG